VRSSVRILLLVAVVVLALVVGAVFGYWLNGRSSLSGAKPATAAQAADLEQRIIQELQAHYYKAVNVEQLSQAGITGLLHSLHDQWTVYMSPQESQTLQEETQGSYSGIGAGLEKKDGKLLVTRVFAGSPALQAGIKAGDVIVTVDGQPTKDASLEVNTGRIKGPEGTQVRLQMRSASSGQVRDLTITRRQIPIPETRIHMYTAGAEKVGYVQLFEFASGVGGTVHKDIAQLQAQGAQWVILDLRYNGGGLLSEAINVTSDFIGSGVVVSTKGLHSPAETFDVNGGSATALPMVVLVNGFTASASEIVTGALQDHRRATVIGTRTFGKGLVQNVIALPGGANLKITTAVYFTPNGRDINKKGIEPAVVVRDDPKTKRDEQLQAALHYIALHQ
jgi:carboxyl-terminal processing protease